MTEEKKSDSDIATKNNDTALVVLKSANLFEQISNDIGDIGIAGEEHLRLMLYIIMTLSSS